MRAEQRSLQQALLTYIFVYVYQCGLIFHSIDYDLLSLFSLILSCPRFGQCKSFRAGCLLCLCDMHQLLNTSLLRRFLGAYTMHSPPQPWDQPFFQGVSVLFERGVLDTNIWVLDMLTVTKVFLLSGYICRKINIWVFFLCFCFSLCIPVSLCLNLSICVHVFIFSMYT